MSSDVDLSVIIPVYNTMPDLERCLESVVAQNLGDYSYEIIAVDDGSTDGGGELLDGYAERYPALHVIHQENSGWPGLPRNVGIDSTRGRYLFFMDADDELAVDSLRRQVAFADEHGSDLVVPMIQSDPGVKPTGSVWRETKIDADRALLFKSLSPQKLFRRRLVDEHDLRFPEGVVPLEDGLMLARAYLLARRVSVLADHEYYYKRKRTKGGNISISRKPPKPFTKSVTEIIDIVKELAGDSTLEDRIVIDLYRRKSLKYLRPTRFPHYDSAMQRDWVDAISELANSRVRTELDARLPLDDKIKSAAVRTGDIEVVRSSVNALKTNSVPAQINGRRIIAHLPAPAEEVTVDATRELKITARLTSLRRKPDAFELEVHVDTRWVDVHGATMELVLRNRSRAARDIVSPIRLTRPAPSEANERAQRTWSAELPMAVLASASPGRWDAYARITALRRGSSTMPEARLRGPSDDSSALLDDAMTTGKQYIRPYLTTYGNLSFEISSSQEARPSASARALSRLSVGAQTHLLRLAGRVLRRLGLTMHSTRDGTVIVLLRSDVAVTPADSRSVVVSPGNSVKVTRLDGVGPVVTDRDARVEPLPSGGGTVLPVKATDQELFDRHTAAFRRLVSEHVAHIADSYDVNCVLDVGANKGQFAKELRRSGYRGHIVSFEPVPDIFKRLERVAAGDPKWTVLPYALGREDGSVEMKVVFGTMSSALGPTDYGRKRYKRFQNITTVDVPLRRLDGLLDEIVPDEITHPRWYLKLDTQGFDIEVFAGLGDRTKEIVAMQSEMALLSIYDGMPRLPAALETYEEAGFEVSGMFPVTREKDTGRVLEFDCVLVRADALKGDGA